MKPALLAIGLALILAGGAPGLAAPRGDAAADPNREICKSQPVVGSRLKRVRQCLTAQQWEEMRQAERQGLLRKQYNGAPGCRGCDVVPGKFGG
jgi:hypothetical protein